MSSQNKNLSIIGIDATNIRAGGGVTHLVELLNQANPELHNFNKIYIWGPLSTLNLINDKKFIYKLNPKSSEQGLLKRTFWQVFRLSIAARNEKCSILFAPGGSYLGNFSPVVTMSQNLLPFEFMELKRFGISFLAFKLLLLRFTQSSSFKKADGLIFLTDYACKTVTKVIKEFNGLSEIIPHGLSPRFNREPKHQKDIAEYSKLEPYRVIYVSIIDQYKHQCNVIEAIYNLRAQGIPIVLDLIGPAYKPALKKMNKKINQLDKDGDFINYYGSVPFEELHNHYATADLGLFASSCENMPNILLETMSSGLPVACSDKGPMPEMLKEYGAYFDPLDQKSILEAILTLINSPSLRYELAEKSYKESQKYSWMRCANETFSFIHQIEAVTKRGL